MTQNEKPQTEAINPPEQGRSMIEMLGTLAIMGVLSIGGIAGYGYAVTKYKANETMEELNNRAIVYATQLKDGDLFSGTALRNGEFGDKTALGYGVSATVSEYENEFNVAVNGVPFEVCEQILKNYKIPTEISVNGNIYNDVTENIDICGEGDTTMVFAFNGDLSNDWENVEVSGNPNDGEITAFQTGTETATSGAQYCDDMPKYSYDNVKRAQSTCALRGGVVMLSEIGCELDRQDGTGKKCSAFDSVPEGYYVVGKLPPSDLESGHSDAFVGYEECLVPYVEYISGSITAAEYFGLISYTPLCWDDYRAMLAESTGTGTYTESTTGTPTVSQTPTVTHSLSPEVTATVTPEVCECSSNAECGENSGKYCHFKNVDSCEAPTCGVCKEISEDAREEVAGVGTYVVKKDNMNWWSAQNYCEALEGSSRMATVADFGCVDGIVGSLIGFCNAEGDYQDSDQTLSENMQAFQIAFGKNDFYWLSDSYDGCSMYTISSYDGYVNTYGRNYSNPSALCHVGN